MSGMVCECTWQAEGAAAATRTASEQQQAQLRAEIEEARAKIARLRAAAHNQSQSARTAALGREATVEFPRHHPKGSVHPEDLPKRPNVGPKPPEGRAAIGIDVGADSEGEIAGNQLTSVTKCRGLSITGSSRDEGPIAFRALRGASLAASLPRRSDAGKSTFRSRDSRSPRDNTPRKDKDKGATGPQG